jgi:hypothetical protein
MAELFKLALSKQPSNFSHVLCSISTKTDETGESVLSFESLILATRVQKVLSLIFPHRKKSQCVICGDRAGQGMGTQQTIHRFEKGCTRNKHPVQ